MKDEGTAFNWIVLPLLILSNNTIAIYRSIYHKPFNQDDFQHVHNAWNQFSGLLVYRDFFEHHGPLYTLFNSFLLSKLDNPASFDTLIFFRHCSFFSALVIFFLVFLISKILLKTRRLAFLSTAVFSMWHIVQSISVEIRPDLLQTLFALLGFYVFLKNLNSAKAWIFVFSGSCFGFMLCSNFKSIILLAAIFIFLFYEYYKEKQHRSLMIGLFILLGALFVYALFGIYFYSQGALNDFLYYNTLHNFRLAKVWSLGGIATRLTLINFVKDFMLCLFTILGIFAMKLNLSSRKLLLICSLLPLFGCLKGFFPYYCITFLPFLSIYAAYGINQHLIKKEMKHKWFAILFFIGIALLTNNINRINYGPSDLYLSQKATLNYALKHFSREAKVASYHRACPVYVFNKDIDYFWFADLDHHAVTKKNPFSINQLKELEKTESPIIAFLIKIYDKRAYREYSHFKKNYQLAGPKPFQCIWLKKAS